MRLAPLLALLIWAAPVRADEALTLTKICVHEAGPYPGDDCPALFDALRNRGSERGYRWDRWAHIYSDRIFDRQRRDHRAWITRLAPPFNRPARWPYSDVVWDRVGPSIRSLYYRARSIVAGLEPSRCVEPPDHWGGPVVDRARIRAGVRRGHWYVVDCGDTRNVFLRVRR